MMSHRPGPARSRIALATLALLPLLGGALLTPAAASGRFDLEALARLARVSDPQISPDGRSIVVIVSRPNYDDNRTDAELVLVDVATGAQRVLTRGRKQLAAPRWSPSGDRLAFLAEALPTPAKKKTKDAAPAADPSAAPAPAPAPAPVPVAPGPDTRPSPFYTDWLGNGLTLGGVVVGSVGLVLWMSGNFAAKDANSAGDLASYRASGADDAVRKQWIGVAGLGVGVGLIAGGIVRYRLRPGREPATVSVVPSTDGATVVLGGRF